MPRVDLTSASFASACRTPIGRDELAATLGTVIVVDLDDGVEADVPEGLAAVPAVVVGTSARPDLPPPGAAWCDTVVASGSPALEAILATVAAAPRASTTLAVLLRQSERLPIAAGLAAESAAFSLLQAGPEFAAWRAARPPRTERGDEGPAVRVERDGDLLEIVLDRPGARNALDTVMRDQLYEALMLAAVDRRLRVRIGAAGPDFCAGGDLDQFGSAPDPASAHLIRLGRSIGLLIAELADRIEVDLRGASVGSGIELPAFAGRVRALSDTRIALPELRMGLIPGAGGTVSITRRAGRHFTAGLALSGDTVDATIAFAHGLVDEVVEA